MEENETFRVVFKRVAVRKSPSVTAEIVGAEKKGAMVNGKLSRVKGQLWVQRCDAGWMLLDGTSLGLGKLLEVLPAMRMECGNIGDRLWHSPLRELPRPQWAPRHGYVALSGGLSATGWRNIWVLGGIIPRLGYGKRDFPWLFGTESFECNSLEMLFTECIYVCPYIYIYICRYIYICYTQLIYRVSYNIYNIALCHRHAN